MRFTKLNACILLVVIITIIGIITSKFFLPDFIPETLFGYFSLASLIFFLITGSDKIAGTLELSSKDYFWSCFSVSIGLAMFSFGFLEVPILLSNNPEQNPLGQVLVHWTITPWSIMTLLIIIEAYLYNNPGLLSNRMKTVKDVIYAVSILFGVAVSSIIGIEIAEDILFYYGFEVPTYALLILFTCIVVLSLVFKFHLYFTYIGKYGFYGILFYMMVMAIFVPEYLFSDIMLGCLDSITNFISYNWISDGDWNLTGFYWSWKLSLAPMIAPYVISISKGRSIRSIIIYCSLLPCIITGSYALLASSLAIDSMDSEGSILINSINSHWILATIFLLLMGIFYLAMINNQSFYIDQYVTKGSKMHIPTRKVLWIICELFITTILMILGTNSADAAISSLNIITIFTATIVVYQVLLIIINRLKTLW